jgi:hypothetical protein
MTAPTARSHDSGTDQTRHHGWRDDERCEAQSTAEHHEECCIIAAGDERMVVGDRVDALGLADAGRAGLVPLLGLDLDDIREVPLAGLERAAEKEEVASAEGVLKGDDRDQIVVLGLGHLLGSEVRFSWVVVKTELNEREESIVDCLRKGRIAQ